VVQVFVLEEERGIVVELNDRRESRREKSGSRHHRVAWEMRGGSRDAREEDGEVV